MEKRRVVITGMGVIAPNGIGIENFWDSLVHGRSGLGRLLILTPLVSLSDCCRSPRFRSHRLHGP